MIDPNGLAFHKITAVAGAGLGNSFDAFIEDLQRIASLSFAKFEDHESYNVFKSLGSITTSDAGGSGQLAYGSELQQQSAGNRALMVLWSQVGKSPTGTGAAQISNTAQNDPPNIVFMFSGAKFSGDGTSETLEEMANELRQIPNTIVVTIGSNFLNDDQLNVAEHTSTINLYLYHFPEAKVYIYGYSYGGVIANEVASRLGDLNITVEYLAIVDAAKGHSSNSLNRTVSSNVKHTDNFYQTTPEFLTGSHGAPYTGINIVNNYHMGYSHSEMDEVTKNAIIIMMRVFMNKKK